MGVNSTIPSASDWIFFWLRKFNFSCNCQIQCCFFLLLLLWWSFYSCGLWPSGPECWKLHEVRTSPVLTGCSPRSTMDINHNKDAILAQTIQSVHHMLLVPFFTATLGHFQCFPDLLQWCDYYECSGEVSPRPPLLSIYLISHCWSLTSPPRLLKADDPSSSL